MSGDSYGSNVDLCRRGLMELGATIVAPGSDGSQLAPGLLSSSAVNLDPDLLLASEIQEVGRDEVVEASERVVLARDAISGLYKRARDLAAIGVHVTSTDEISDAMAAAAPEAARSTA